MMEETMSGFDSLNEQLEQLYLEAVKQREEKLAELQKLEDTIAKLSPLYAGKKYNLDILKAAEPVRATPPDTTCSFSDSPSSAAISGLMVPTMPVDGITSGKIFLSKFMASINSSEYFQPFRSHTPLPEA